MDSEQKREYEELLTGESYFKVRAMNKTVYETGVERGQKSLVGEQLQERFGPLPTKAVDRLDQLTAERLREVGKALLRANSLKELGLVDD